jgi:hypothetical protein
MFNKYINAIYDSQSERPTVLSRKKPQDQACSRQMYQQNEGKKTGAIASCDWQQSGLPTEDCCLEAQTVKTFKSPLMA